MRLTIFVYIIGSILIVLLFRYFLVENQRNLVNFFTLYGTYASLYGLIIAYLQLIKIKVAAQQTKIAVQETSIRMNQILSVSDLSKSIKTIQEIQNYMMAKKYELALLRMKDLRFALNTVQHSQNITNTVHSETYSQCLVNLGIDIVNLNDLINGYKTGLNFSKVNQNLDSLETFIGNIENELKYKSHDTR